MDYRTYRVLEKDRGPLLEFVLGALRDTGCTIIRNTPATEAPFRVS